MPKCLLATFGWTEQFVLSSILKHGIEPGDIITLLIPDKRDEKSEAVLRDFKSFLSRYGEGIELRIEKIPLESFEQAVIVISKILDDILSLEPDRLIINLSGGMRALILATYIAALLICPEDTIIELETENREKGYLLPNFALRELIKLKGSQLAILSKLSDRPKTASDLLKELRIPRSTLHKHLKELKRHNLIILGREGRNLHAEMTALGKLVLLANK